MKNIYIAGPGQNIDWETHGKERSLPQLFASDLNALTGESEAFQVWNNNTPLTHAEWEAARSSGDPISFNDFCIAAIARKNDFLISKGYPETISYATDTEEAYTEWLAGRVDTFIEDGRVYEAESDFIACRRCGATIAEVGAGAPTFCKLCKSEAFTQRSEKALFLDIPEHVGALLQPDIVEPANRAVANRVVGMFKELPPRIPLNKKRAAGVSLDHLGFEHQVVNPKIAIALLPEYLAETQVIDAVTQIQSPSTATNTIPYTYLLKQHEYDNKYVFFNKGPSGILADLDTKDKGFYGYLLQSLSHRMSPMRSDEYETVRAEFGKLRQSIEGAYARFSAADSYEGAISLEDDAAELLATIQQSQVNGDVAAVYAQARTLINKLLIPKYVRVCKADRVNLAAEDFAVIRSVLDPIFY